MQQFENKIVPISKIFPNEYNPKNLQEQNPQFKETVELLKTSLEIHGQMIPIRVREIKGGNYEIVDGYHTYLACKAIGKTEVEIKSFGKISETEAQKRLLSLERIKNPVDFLMETRLIKALSENSDLEQLAKEIPYSIDEINERKMFEQMIKDLESPQIAPKPETPQETVFVIPLSFESQESKQECLDLMKGLSLETGEDFLNFLKNDE